MTEYSIILKDLALELNLGLTSQERSSQQTVMLQIKIIFPKKPLACSSNDIKDTVCYATLIKIIQDFCRHQQFILIEELGEQLFTVIKNNIPPKCRLQLQVQKHRPLPELLNSIFEIKE